MSARSIRTTPGVSPAVPPSTETADSGAATQAGAAAASGAAKGVVAGTTGSSAAIAADGMDVPANPSSPKSADVPGADGVTEVYEASAPKPRLPGPGDRIMGVSSAVFSHRVPDGDGFGLGTYVSSAGFLDFLESAKARLWLQMPTLPTGDETSPYVPRSSIGSNPILIDLREVPEFKAAGGVEGLQKRLPGRNVQQELATAQSAPRIRYDLVLPLKNAALRMAFEHFHANEWTKKNPTPTPAAKALSDFQTREAPWLHDYARFEALSRKFGGAPHWEWPPELAKREPAALEAADADPALAREMLFIEWSQMHAQRQNEVLFQAADQKGILIFADKPTGVHENSADVWRFPRLFCRTEADFKEGGDASKLMRLGVGKELNPLGEDWPIPFTNYPEMAKDDFAWMRTQIRCLKRTSHGIRWDHANAPFLQYVRSQPQPAQGPFVAGRYIPATQAEQERQGRQVYGVALEEAGWIIPEDLGAVPDFVRAALIDLGIGGLTIYQWQRKWPEPGQPFIPKEEYLPVQVAATGTHDMPTLRARFEAPGGWQSFREQSSVFSALDGLQAGTRFTPRLQQTILEEYASVGSNLVLLPEQDVWGSTEVMNVPGTVSDLNWTYVSPLDQNTRKAGARIMRAVAEKTGRVIE